VSSELTTPGERELLSIDEQQKKIELLEIKLNALRTIGIMAVTMFTKPSFYPGWDAWEREEQAVRHAKSIFAKL
jgi:hypothetical protein